MIPKKRTIKHASFLMGKCASACVPGEEEEDDPWLGRVGAAKQFHGYRTGNCHIHTSRIGKGGAGQLEVYRFQFT